MKKWLPAVAALTALALSAPASASSASPREQDCRAPNTPSGNPAADAAGDSMPRETLSDRLTTCGSVFLPPKVGDPDMIESPPKTNDPIDIRPDSPPETGR